MTALPATAGQPETATRITVMHRGASGRWRKVGAVWTWREAVALIDRGGDWWLRRAEVEDDADLGLFDAEGE
jgi:hypothetical protein